jgi:alkylation response protein AidB-like acyl-CoA dehydrogenase
MIRATRATIDVVSSVAIAGLPGRVPNRHLKQSHSARSGGNRETVSSTMRSMTKQVFDAIHDCAARIRSLGPVGDALGRLDTRTVGLVREAGLTRMLQPEDYGGFATHPADFAEAVMEIAALDGSTGWVAGMIGTTPWELSMTPRRMRDEVWEADADSWVASALGPAGVLWPVGDGYFLNGRWQSVAGIDHCDWALLGARLVGADERLVHVMVPRSDLRIVDDSSNVAGLIGTGSKDVVADDAIVPGYRMLEHDDVVTGTAAQRAALKNPIHHLPFSTVYPLGSCAAVIGMAEGALAQHHAVGECEAAAAEIRTARLALLDIVMEFFYTVLDGRRIDDAMRARSRRDQLHAVRRAVRALDDIVDRSGSDAMRQDSPLQRFWRDAHVGLAHAVRAPTDARQLVALGEISKETRICRRHLKPASAQQRNQPA